MSGQSLCLWQQCWYHRPSSSVTHYNEHFTQILSPLSLSTTLSPSSTSLCLFSLSLFSQLDSRDNNAVSVFLSFFFFSKSVSLISSQTNTAPPCFATTLPLFQSLSLFPPCKSSLLQTKSPVILDIPTFLSTFHYLLAAWIALIASFGLRGHPLAWYCGLHYEQLAGITIQ